MALQPWTVLTITITHTSIQIRGDAVMIRPAPKTHEGLTTLDLWHDAGNDFDPRTLIPTMLFLMILNPI